MVPSMLHDLTHGYFFLLCFGINHPKKYKFLIFFIKLTMVGAGKMIYQIRALNGLTENPSSVPSIHIRQLKTVVSGYLKQSSDLFWARTLMGPHSRRDTVIHTSLNLNIINI